jgi:O-antigen ligase
MMWSGGSALVIMAAFVCGAPWRQGEASRVVRSIQRVILLGGLSIVILSAIYPEEVNSRLAVYSETLSPYSTASELAWRTREYPMRNFLAAFDTPRWMYGYGTGTASLGIQYVMRVLHTPSTGISVENGYGQLVIEMGIVGLLLWLVLGASVVISVWKIVRQLRGSPWFPIAFVIFWFIFLVFFPMGYNTLSFYQDFLVNAYLWILIGILYRLPSIALSARFAAESREVRSGSAPRQATVPSVVATTNQRA